MHVQCMTRVHVYTAVLLLNKDAMPVPSPTNALDKRFIDKALPSHYIRILSPLSEIGQTIYRPCQ